VGVRVAALYDVHGNVAALEAVLAEVGEEAPEVVVFGGDLVWGPWPSECLALAEGFGDRAVPLRGNCERLVLDSASPAHAWARDRLSDAERARIAAWPLTARIDVEGLGPALFCHATPRSDEEILTAESPPEAWRDALAGVDERVVVCGHTHLQLDRELGGVRIVNPGSVGAPTIRPVAWWAMLGPGVELRTTAYDTEATIAAARELVPDIDGFAGWLRDPPSYEARVRALSSP
jgi:predicted phosphodiesterase